MASRAGAAGLPGDLWWLCGEGVDSRIVLDPADLGRVNTTSMALCWTFKGWWRNLIVALSCTAFPCMSNGNCNACVLPTNSMRLTAMRPPFWSLRPRTHPDPVGFMVAVPQAVL
jgi:hypothetical protein